MQPLAWSDSPPGVSSTAPLVGAVSAWAGVREVAAVATFLLASELWQLKVDSIVLCLSYGPTGDILAVGDRGGSIRFFNAKGEKTLSREWSQ